MNFKKKIWYLENYNFRIVFGLHLKELGKSFRLQKKSKIFFFKYWKTVSWTYPVSGNTELNENVKNFLFWKYEKYINS